jgi:hypothetical protein
MKTTYKVGLAIVTSLAVGAVAVQSLHAQAKPSSDKEKIANAMTAAPPAVSRDARNRINGGQTAPSGFTDSAAIDPSTTLRLPY